MSVVHAHRQRITVHDILGQEIEGGQIDRIRLHEIQGVSESLKHIRATLSDIVRQELNPVGAHHRQQGVMSLLKVGLAELRLYGGQFALQDRDKEVPASASRLQETRV